MAKKIYSATFSSGLVITRASTNNYQAAWCLTIDEKRGQSGFSKNAELAYKAATREKNFVADHVDRNIKNDRLSKIKIEVVPVALV